MAYILVTIIRGGKYFVQNYPYGHYQLNGLQENAVKYPNEEMAREEKIKLQRHFTADLHVEEILPKD